MSDSFGEYVCTRCLRVGRPTSECLHRKCDPPEMSVPCNKCGAPHEVGRFGGRPLPEVDVIDAAHARNGQRGQVVDWWHWVGSTEWIRVEFADRKRMNFAPCQLRRMTSARFESIDESRKAAVAARVDRLIRFKADRPDLNHDPGDEDTAMTSDVYTRIVCPLCRCSALVDWLPAPSGHGRIMEHDAMVEAPDFEVIAEMRCPATGRTVRRTDRGEP